MKIFADAMKVEKRQNNDAACAIVSIEKLCRRSAGLMEKNVFLFKELILAERNIRLSGASAKMILEHVGLLLPILSHPKESAAPLEPSVNLV